MNLQGFTIILASVFLSAVAQLSFKYGVSSILIKADSHLIAKALAFLFSPFVLLGLSLYGVGTVLWLFALRQVDLSLAYPFVGMSFIFVLLFSAFFLQEAITLNRILGTLVIVGGLVILSRS
jgi:drug/metabolite transporter (DMT)-like permease